MKSCQSVLSRICKIDWSSKTYEIKLCHPTEEMKTVESCHIQNISNLFTPPKQEKEILSLLLVWVTLIFYPVLAILPKGIMSLLIHAFIVIK